ncbi:MAG: class II fumarate hydratase [Bacteroidota bacterium]
MRTESDSLGPVRIPADAYWGAQTQRAIANFPVSGITFPPVFIRSLALIKHACADVNRDLRLLDRRFAHAIIRSCEEIVDGKFEGQFPLDIFQTGSGTSTNMNVNEVIATRSNEIITGTKQTTAPVHPNDHVNMGQSSNDVIPSTIHVAAVLQAEELLLPSLKLLQRSIRTQSRKNDSVVKTGRTHLMDAMPLTIGQELSGWESQIAGARREIQRALPRLAELAIGGTAVGTGINAPKGFGGRVVRRLSRLTERDFREAPNHFAAQASQDAVAAFSGQLRALATALIKIANDLRWMSSGPMAGLGEIRLPALQPGSSIMPGKVNPVIPEAVRMAAAQVMGNDTVVAVANAMGEFQLNVMLPVIAHNLLQEITILATSTRLLAGWAIDGMEVNDEHIRESLLRNPIIATVLNPVIGYEKAAEVVKKSLAEKKSVKEVVLELGYLTKEEADRILDPAGMTGPRRVRQKERE